MPLLQAACTAIITSVRLLTTSPYRHANHHGGVTWPCMRGNMRVLIAVNASGQ